MNKFSILAIALLAITANSVQCTLDIKLDTTADAGKAGCTCGTTNVATTDENISDHYCKTTDSVPEGTLTAFTTCSEIEIKANSDCLCGASKIIAIAADNICNKATGAQIKPAECRATGADAKDSGCFCKGHGTKLVTLKENEYCIASTGDHALKCVDKEVVKAETKCDCDGAKLDTLAIGDSCVGGVYTKKPTSGAAAVSAGVVGAAIVNLLL